MQYKDLQLDRIQAFAPVPKQIDKQNYKDMAEALMNLGARGADVYASYKINQIPMGKERDLALAEYQLLRHQDPSALQRIEERRYDDYWRDRQENVQREMLEQLRAEAEEELRREAEEKRREDEITYNDIIRARSALNDELTKAMNEYNSANASTTDYIDVYDTNTRYRFLKKHANELLNKFNENKTQEERLGFKPKEVKNVDIRDSVKVKDVDEGDILQETGDSTEQESKIEPIDISKMVFDSTDKREWYLTNEDVPLSILTDEQKTPFKDHIKNKYKFYGDKIISDGLGEKEKEKLKQFGYKFITKADMNKAIKAQNAEAQKKQLKREEDAVKAIAPRLWQGTLQETYKWMKGNFSDKDYNNYKKAIEDKLKEQ